MLSLLPKSKLAYPPQIPNIIHLQDPAIKVMIHLEHITASTVSLYESISDIQLVEKVNAEHLLFVTNEIDQILGIITGEEIHGEKPYQVMQEKQLKRSELTIEMVMTPTENIPCIEVKHLQDAKVSHLIATLIDSKQHYALAVEKNSYASHTIKGFFWASLIGQRLSQDILSTDPSLYSTADLQELHS